MRGFIKNKKGFSLVEAVVAIAVIMIVSMAAVTSFTLALAKTQKHAAQSEARTLCENMIECYEYANGNVEEFWSITEELLDIEKPTKTDSKGWYAIRNEYYVIKIKFDNSGKFIAEAYYKNEDQKEPYRAIFKINDETSDGGVS